MPLGNTQIQGERGNRLYRGDAVLGKQFRGEAAESAQHGPAGVDHLDLTVAREGLRIGRQTRCVPAIVTCGIKLTNVQ